MGTTRSFLIRSAYHNKTIRKRVLAMIKSHDRIRLANMGLSPLQWAIVKTLSKADLTMNARDFPQSPLFQTHLKGMKPTLDQIQNELDRMIRLKLIFHVGGTKPGFMIYPSLKVRD